jgi:hypothetical protein
VSRIRFVAPEVWLNSVALLPKEAANKRRDLFAKPLENVFLGAIDNRNRSAILAGKAIARGRHQASP